MDFALWPAHPRILPGEILSSWLVRIAHANGFQAREFSAYLLGYDREIWRRDVDHLAPQRLIALLARRTGVSVEDIEATTLKVYEGVVFERFVQFGTTKWVLPLGIKGRTKRIFGQQYCPACLASDRVPYLRLEWRMAFKVACTEHAVLLADRCPFCAKALEPYRINLTPEIKAHAVLRFCGHCCGDLSSSAVPATAQAMRLQLRLDEVVNHGYVKVGGEVVYSHLFLDGVQHLMTGLRRKSRGGERYGRAIFESQQAIDRLARMSEVFDLLEDWPNRLLKRCCDLSQPYRRFVRQKEVMPWWLWSVLRRDVFRAQSELREDEVKAILDATEKITGCRSGVQARMLSGRNVSSNEHRDCATEDEVDELIAAMDRRISVASEALRIKLLRDKVIFLVARRRHLSASALAAMTVHEAVREDDCSGAFWCNARRPGDVERLIGWYLRNVRLEIAPEAKSDALFISRSGQGLTHVAIGANLRSAVQFAGMRSRLASWPFWSAR